MKVTEGKPRVAISPFTSLKLANGQCLWRQEAMSIRPFHDEGKPLNYNKGGLK